MDLPTLMSWPSLACQIDLHHDLFGPTSTGLAKWCAQQVAFITDPEFARLFSDNITAFNVASCAYNHRHIVTGDGELLGGIRFYGLDVERPFVDIIAHSFDDLNRLRAAVWTEWQIFEPQFLRLIVAKNHMPAPDAILDLSIHAAPYAAMKSGGECLKLNKLKTAAPIHQLVQKRYHALAQSDLKLSRQISPATPKELQGCAREDGVFAAYLDGFRDPIGIIAICAGAVDWILGDVVIEEVIVQGHAGEGYAAEMQQMLAQIRAVDHPTRLLVGTIDRHNHASRKTAIRAGRPEILRKIFLPLNAGASLERK